MKKRKRHSPEQIIRKLREADAMLAAGKQVEHVCQKLEVSLVGRIKERSDAAPACADRRRCNDSQSPFRSAATLGPAYLLATKFIDKKLGRRTIRLLVRRDVDSKRRLVAKDRNPRTESLKI